MQRKSWQILLSVILVTAVGLAFAVYRHPRFQKWYRPPLAQLPSPAEIEQMRATLVDSHVGFERTPEFVVPKDQIPSILRWLQPAEYVSDPPIRPPDLLGHISIQTTSGQEIYIQFYWAGKNPAVFTLDGEDYFWGNDKDEQGWVDGGIRLAKAVRRAFEASQKQRERDTNRP